MDKDEIFDSKHLEGDVVEEEEGVDVVEPAGDLVAQARQLLWALNFDAERSNERSALVLLALARLKPDQTWAEATNPLLRTVEIMDFLRQYHGKDYKPNTRETIRRQTLHQFADPAYMIRQNPDDPSRPVNSPKWCYQLTDRAVGLIRKFGTAEFGEALDEYLADLPGQRVAYAAEREVNRVPVTLPGGKDISLSPGGQNELIRLIVEEFCPQYTPGGVVLYIGDAGDKWQHFEKDALADLGLKFDEHGKMPDLVVYWEDKNWLVLLEAASSHGPVDSKRHAELQTLFAGSRAGLVFVSCFPSRREMRKELKNISWETEVWCADAPTHMIHFDGERFLGPYGTAHAKKIKKT
ncbi:MAG: restriction endonuclease [Mycobacterium sp.]|nr:restriction endonuclease [Mycobacterium sp.]